MANHCIDLLCLGCGARWCCRCGDEYAALTAEQLGARKVKRPDEKRVADEKCLRCLSQNVVLE